MFIQNNYSINFMSSKKNVQKKGNIALKNIIKNNNLKKNNSLYSDIDLYLNSVYNKEEYLEAFIQKVVNKNFPKKLKNSEKTYINDLKTSIDLAYDIKDIPENYLLNRIKNLLQSFK